MAWNDIDIGAVSAYAVAVEQGYKGTAEEWARDQAEAGNNARSAKESAETAVNAAKRAEEALAGLTPKTEEAIKAIEEAGAEQSETVKTEGAAQVQAVRDAGAEQSTALAAQGDVEQRKVVAAGDAQEGRVNEAATNAVEAVASEGEKQNTAIAETAEAKKQEAVDAVNQVGEEQISAVESAGQEKVDAIADEGKRVLDSIPADYPESIAAAQIELVDKLCPPFEASGSVVTCNPVEGYPLHVVSRIDAVQEGEGDPSPDNVRPITGWNAASVTRTGRNLLNIPDYKDTMTNVIRADTNELFAAVEYKEATQYTLSMEVSSENTSHNFGFEVDYSDGTRSYHWLKQGAAYVPAATTKAGKTVAAIRISYDAAHVVTITNVQLEEGATATAHKAYQGASHTAEMPETVYGGTLDWTTGVLTVDKAVKVFDGTENFWIYSSGTDAYNTFDNTSVFACIIKDKKIGFGTSICNIFQNTQNDDAYTPGRAQSGMYTDHDTTTNMYFAWGNSGQSVEEFKAWVAEQYTAGMPVTIVYDLAEPYTIQLTPQQISALSGVNTLWSSTGDTAVSGRVDPIYINQTMMDRIAALEDAIVNA